MARIRAAHGRAAFRVSIAGRLTAADLRRLEYACGPALTLHPIPVELEMKGVTAMDRAAAAFVQRMAQRGATIITGHGDDKTASDQ